MSLALVMCHAPSHATALWNHRLFTTWMQVAEVGESGSHVRVDAFLDLVCVDTKRAWPTVRGDGIDMGMAEASRLVLQLRKTIPYRSRT